MISLMKLINLISVIALCSVFAFGCGDFAFLIGVVLYGFSLRNIGSSLDKELPM